MKQLLIAFLVSFGLISCTCQKEMSMDPYEASMSFKENASYELKIERGDIVKHRLTGDTLMVLDSRKGINKWVLTVRNKDYEHYNILQKEVIKLDK